MYSQRTRGVWELLVNAFFSPSPIDRTVSACEGSNGAKFIDSEVQLISERSPLSHLKFSLHYFSISPLQVIRWGMTLADLDGLFRSRKVSNPWWFSL